MYAECINKWLFTKNQWQLVFLLLHFKHTAAVCLKTQTSLMSLASALLCHCFVFPGGAQWQSSSVHWSARISIQSADSGARSTLYLERQNHKQRYDCTGFLTVEDHFVLLTFNSEVAADTTLGESWIKMYFWNWIKFCRSKDGGVTLWGKTFSISSEACTVT